MAYIDQSADNPLKEALRDCEDRLAFAMEHNDDGLWDWDIARGRVFFSQRWKEMLGYEEEDIGDEYDEWRQRVHPDDWEKVVAAARRHEQGDAPYYTAECRVQCKNGSYKWILTRGKVMCRDASGRPLRIVGTHIDISAQKQAEFALRASEERYRKLVELSPDAIFVNQNGKLSYVNPACLHLFGAATPQQLLGKTPFDLFHPDCHKAIRERLTYVLQNDAPAPLIELKIVRLDGALVDVEVSSVGVRDGDGWAIQAILRDITDRKLAQRRLRENEERARLLFDNSQDAVYLLDVETTRIVDVNPAFLALFGYTHEEACCLHVTDLSSEPQESLLSIKTTATTTGRARIPQRRYHKKDGTPLLVELHADMFELHGRLVMCSVVRDITEQRRTEETLRRHNAYLDALYDTTLGLLNRLEINSLLQAILSRASSLLAASGGFLCLHNAEQDTMEMRVASGPGAHLSGIHFKRNEGLAGRVWVTEQPLTIDHYTSWNGRLQLRELDSIQAMTGVPLWVGHRVIGVLGLNRQDGNIFTEPEVEILNRFGQLASLALENARLFAAAQQEIEERRRVEAALQESELRLRRLVEHLPAGAVYVDGDMLFMNKAAENITGYAREELPDLDHWFQQLYSADHTMLRAQYEDARKAGFGPPKVEDVTQKDGTVRQIEITPFREGAIEVWLLRDITESERLARLMAQTEFAAGVGGWEVDCRTNETYWTPEMYRILAESTAGQHQPSIFNPASYHPADHQRLNDAANAAMQSGEPFDLELERLDPIRPPMWVRITGRAECQNGRPVKLYGSLQNITERKQIEEALRASEEKYRALLETTNTGYCIIDERGRLLDANAAYVRLTGHGSLAEILGRNILDWTAPYDLARNAEGVRQCLAAGYLRDLEIDYINRSGQSTPVEISATMILADGGVRLLALCRDITQRRQAEAALRESEERFRQLAEHIDEAFWLADNQKVLYISPAYEKIWGLTVTQAGENPWAWLDAVHPEDRARVHDASVTKTLRGEYDEQYRVIHADGTIRWIHDRAFPIRDERGEMKRIAGVAKDITAQRRQEEAQQSLIECSRVTGQAFFTTMVQTLATVLEARHVMLCELPKDLPGVVRTIAYANDGALAGNMTYRLEGTPCADVFHQQTCFFRRDVAALFPEDLRLAELGIESYLGTALHGASGEILGLLVVMHDSPIDETMQPATILEIFAGRAASELEREAAVQHVQRLNTELEQRVRERTLQLETAHEAVRMSESRQRAMLAAIPDLVFRISSEGEFLDFSATTDDTLIPADKIVGSNIRELPLAVEVIERSLAAYQLAIATNEIQTIEYSIEAAGSKQYYESRIVRSGPDEVISIVRNITSRVEAEAALRHSEQRLRQIIDLVPHWIFAKDIEGRYILANKALADANNTTVDAMIGTCDADFGWSTDEIDQFRKDDIEVLQSGQIKSLPEEQTVDFAGRQLVLHTIKIPFTFSGATTPSVLGVSTDITELKRVEESLRISEARQRALLSAIPDAMLRMNRAGVCLDVSDPHGVLASPSELLIGSNMRAWPLPVAVIEQGLAAHERALDTGEIQTVEYSYAAPSGIRYYESRVVRSNADEVVAILRDITDRKMVELRARQLNEELEERVRQRTAELEVANRELESFSYSVSHDLRAPLRAINGFSQALLEDYGHLLDDDAHNYLARVRAASQRMGVLIDDLLNLSRVTRHEIHLAPVDLSALAASIAAELHATDSARQVTFVIAADLSTEADPNLIQIVLENLLSNAWKYTSRHPTARIEFGALQQDGKQIYFVKDDGAGFDMTYADKLFQAFQRLHNESEFAGAGVGLATVERIIHRHGGRVWAEGNVGVGAIFYFTLG